MDPLHSAHRRVAILIDAENASASSMAEVMQVTSQYGTPIIRRAYGDWTNARLGSWREVLLEHAIQPVQQFSYTTGKNATDGAMIIDAMDLLHARQAAGFCIVSSDSDFTRLATRLRESDIVVLGFGNRQTPRSFEAACHRFFHPTSPVAGTMTIPIVAPRLAKRLSTEELRADKELVEALLRASTTSADARGCSALSKIGKKLKDELRGFAPKRYGFDRLSELLVATEMFVMEKRGKTEMVARPRKRLEAKA